MFSAKVWYKLYIFLLWCLLWLQICIFMCFRSENCLINCWIVNSQSLLCKFRVLLHSTSDISCCNLYVLWYFLNLLHTTSETLLIALFCVEMLYYSRLLFTYALNLVSIQITLTHYFQQTAACKLYSLRF